MRSREIPRARRTWRGLSGGGVRNVTMAGPYASTVREVMGIRPVPSLLSPLRLQSREYATSMG